jgi:hypothetical protein
MAGAARLPAPTFSAAVMVYRCDLPVRTPCGVLMLHWNTFCPAAHLQVDVSALMSGPARVTCTLPARARAAAILGPIAAPAQSESRNLTVIVRADLLSVDFGLGAVKPEKP